jgi:ParB family chromosome partitioning protein
MPEDIRELCRLADIQSKSVLLQVVRQGTPEKMIALVERLQTEGTTRAKARRLTREPSARRGKGRPRNFVFKYQPKGERFALTLRFQKAQVPRQDVIEALESILQRLKSEPD